MVQSDTSSNADASSSVVLPSEVGGMFVLENAKDDFGEASAISLSETGMHQTRWSASDFVSVPDPDIYLVLQDSSDEDNADADMMVDDS